jgi:MFS family permease
LSDLIGRKYGLALVYLTQAASFAVFALWQDSTGYTVSAVLFGLTAWSIPSIVAAACGDYLGPRMAPAALGFATLFFGLGQAAGPSVAGAIADATGSFGPAFLMAAGVALLGGVGSLLLRPPHGAVEVS